MPNDTKVMIFQSRLTNTGAAKHHDLRVIELKKNGQPIKAGDIKPGQTITFNRETGEIEDDIL